VGEKTLIVNWKQGHDIAQVVVSGGRHLKLDDFFLGKTNTYLRMRRFLSALAASILFCQISLVVADEYSHYVKLYLTLPFTTITNRYIPEVV
jgi:hypothetical protein